MPANFPSPPWETHFARCLQGGGIIVYGGTVAISSSTISGNTAVNVRAKSSHRPDGNLADVLASILAYTTAADAPVNYRLMYVPQRLEIAVAPMGDSRFARCFCRAAVSKSLVAQCQS
jgi:hypothetical protein